MKVLTVVFGILATMFLGRNAVAEEESHSRDHSDQTATSAPSEQADEPDIISNKMKRKTRLEVGDEAPDFEFVSAGEDAATSMTLSDFQGKKNIVVYLDPLIEANYVPVKTLADRYDELQELETAVIVVSMVSEEEAKRVKTEQELPYPVVSDTEHKIVDAYKGLIYDDEGVKRPRRAIFVCDKEGKIKYRKYDARWRRDQAPMMKALRELNGMEVKKAKQTE